jgi:hypothetical protein
VKPPAAGRVDYFDDATAGLSLRQTMFAAGRSSTATRTVVRTA